MGIRRLLDPDMEAAAAAWGFGCPRGYGGAIIGYLMALTHGKRSSWILDRLAILPSDRVLEIGFGPGTEIKRAAQLACQGFVAGIDVSAVMLGQAQRRNRENIRQGRVELRLASMQEIPYPSQGFDKVFAVNSIQFATDLSQALKEIRRVLKPGGVAALAVQPLWKGASKASAAEIGRALAGAMAEAGFRGVEAAERHLWPRSMVCVFGRAPETVSMV
ncbi:MAG: class I SAM-dependent methyltransferase [Acidobacteriota bacterium]